MLAPKPNPGDNRPRKKYEIQLSNGLRSAVTPDIFNHWTGRRYIDGDEHHATLISFDGKPYKGARACGCRICQEFVAPACSPNATGIRGPQGEA